MDAMKFIISGDMVNFYKSLGLPVPKKENKKLIDWDKIRLSEKQKKIYEEMNRLQPRLTIFHGAIRSGKTYLACLIFIKKRLEMSKNIKSLLLGYSEKTVQENVYPALKSICEELQINYEAKKDKFIIDGVESRVVGTSNELAVGRIRGTEAGLVYGNEATFCLEEAFREVLERSSIKNAMVIWDTNPSHPSHWLLKDYIEKDYNNNYHFTLFDNPYLPKDYLDQLLINNPKDTLNYNRKILGLWQGDEGMPFYEVITAHYNPVGDLFAVIDPAIEDDRDYTALAIGWISEGKVIIHGRLWKRSWGNCVYELAQEIRTSGVKWVYYEKNSTGRVLGDILYNDYGIINEGFHSTIKKENRIFSIENFVKSGRVVINSTSDESFIDQFRNYSPEAEHDDAPDSVSLLVSKMRL